MKKENMIISMDEKKSWTQFKSDKDIQQVLTANTTPTGSTGSASPWGLELDKDALSPPEGSLHQCGEDPVQLLFW